jgi:hypothetical protein
VLSEPPGATWWTPRLLPTAAAAAPKPAGASAFVNAGGAAALHWLASSSLLVSGGLGSLGILFGLWAIQQVMVKSKGLQGVA